MTDLDFNRVCAQEQILRRRIRWIGYAIYP